MRKTLPVAVATCGLALFGFALPASAAPEDDAMLSVLHGVPDLTVDVYVDGELTLDDFAPGDLAGPLELPAGGYEIAITAADAADASEPVLGPVEVELESGMSHTAVAHLDAAGEPTVTAFTDDTSALEAGQGRLTVRHVAAAPAVDVWANGEVAIKALENPQEKVLELAAGSLEAAVSVSGQTDPVLGPTAVDVTEGANTIVYAWGSAEDGNLALATQTVEGMHSAPEGVPTGDTRLPADQQGLMLAGGAGLMVLLSAGALAARRRTADRA